MNIQLDVASIKSNARKSKQRGNLLEIVEYYNEQNNLLHREFYRYENATPLILLRAFTNNPTATAHLTHDQYCVKIETQQGYELRYYKHINTYMSKSHVKNFMQKIRHPSNPDEYQDLIRQHCVDVTKHFWTIFNPSQNTNWIQDKNYDDLWTKTTDTFSAKLIKEQTPDKYTLQLKSKDPRFNFIESKEILAEQDINYVQIIADNIIMQEFMQLSAMAHDNAIDAVIFKS